MRKLSDTYKNQPSLFSEEDFQNKMPYVVDNGDDNHYVGECDKIFQDRLIMLKSFGYDINDLVSIAKDFNFPDYMISVYKYMDDKKLYDNDYKSYRFIHDTLDDMWERRKLKIKSTKEKSFYRTVFQTVLDIGTDALVTQFLKKSIEKLNLYNIRINKRDGNFKLTDRASTEPDFHLGKSSLLEMKISTNTRYGFMNNDTEFQIKPNLIKNDLTKYENYNNLYFLRIDANTNKMIVLAYNEFDKNGHAKFSSNRVKRFKNLDDFGVQLNMAIKETVKALYNKNGIRKSN